MESATWRESKFIHRVMSGVIGGKNLYIPWELPMTWKNAMMAKKPRLLLPWSHVDDNVYQGSISCAVKVYRWQQQLHTGKARQHSKLMKHACCLPILNHAIAILIYRVNRALMKFHAASSMAYASRPWKVRQKSSRDASSRSSPRNSIERKLVFVWNESSGWRGGEIPMTHQSNRSWRQFGIPQSSFIEKLPLPRLRSSLCFYSVRLCKLPLGSS